MSDTVRGKCSWFDGVCGDCGAKVPRLALFWVASPFISPGDSPPVCLCKNCFDERTGLLKSGQPLPPIGRKLAVQPDKVDEQEAAILRCLGIPAEC